MSSHHVLFRQEAIDFQQYNRQWGHVVLLQPPSAEMITWCIVILVVVVITFLSFGQYARKETVIGYLTPTSGTAKIFAPQQGTIKEIYVSDGDQVQEGQALMTVETDQIAANGYDVNTTMLNTLSSQKDL